MEGYAKAFEELNTEQRRAVNKIDGPLLVIAGPGTGKTQLLSTRVAHILKNTDTLPGNILCLTFTDNAARNMRERLGTIIGQAAYHVAIHTFHSFGSEVINQNSDYFERSLIQQVDELGRYELLRTIFEQLPHGNPLSKKVGDDYIFLKDTLDVVSLLKQNAIAPEELRQIIKNNDAFMRAITVDLASTFSDTPAPKYLQSYISLLKKIQSHVKGKSLAAFPEYAELCAAELGQAIAETPPDGRYAKPITAWRNAWCQKDSDGRHVFKDSGQNLTKMRAVADAYEALLETMSEQGLYDFDDMVMEAVQAMEGSDELRYNLQERYQYILVDEFQDTNKAQLRMLLALGDNPVYEGQPNIMVVGDDDQAIYAFQGAETSNMTFFIRHFKLEPIVLKENYRSNANILSASQEISNQLTDRLSTAKVLVAKKTYQTKILDYLSFSSELSQYDWIALEIEKLIKKGTKPEEIAVIAPRHRYLERLMPYLGQRQIPVAYERRENILEAPIIVQLLTTSELITAVAENRQDDVDGLISQVLGYDFWQFTPETLIDISITAYKKRQHWLEILLKHKNRKLRASAGWFIDLAKRSELEPMEYILDRIVGGDDNRTDNEYDELLLPTTKPNKFISPFRDYYFSDQRFGQATDTYLTLLGQLSTLRQRLRQWKPNRTIYIKDLTDFAELHFSAGLKIIDTNPHTQSTNAVQVMSTYKAKGLEFEVVFVINAQDEIWGPTARSGSSKISLPRNLAIERAGDSDNDKLRLLFVALTRAKHTLYVTGYSHNLNNELSPPLSFLVDSSGLQPRAIEKPATIKAVEILSTDWSYRFRQIIADRPTLFEPILADYKLSVTHLNNFIDFVSSGPDYFMTHNLLRFPQAQSPSAAYGSAIHETIKWVHTELRAKDALPKMTKVQAYFEDMLRRKHLKSADRKRLTGRGQEALQEYLLQMPPPVQAKDIVERGFNNEGVVVNEARLSGKIDVLRFTEGGRAEVRDFKTGSPTSSWQGKDIYEKIKLHKYRQQLMFYKLLVEGSASYSKRLVVTLGALEFVEADTQGKRVSALELDFNQEELNRFSRLIGAIWQHIMKLDFPDTSGYPQTLEGIIQFEEDLLK